jgi:transposase-like protein
MTESADGKCPFCASDYVVKTCTFDDDTSAEKPGQPRIVTYKCYTCNKEFYCREEG